MPMPWRKLDELLRDPSVEGKEFIEKEMFDRVVPDCPDCKKPLIYRLPHERFMEDDNYVQCVNGHVWELLPPPDGHHSAKELIKLLADRDSENVNLIAATGNPDINMLLARLLFEGRLFAKTFNLDERMTTFTRIDQLKEDEECDHDFFEPRESEVLEMNGYEVCRHCGKLKPPKE